MRISRVLGKSGFSKSHFQIKIIKILKTNAVWSQVQIKSNFDVRNPIFQLKILKILKIDGEWA